MAKTVTIELPDSLEEQLTAQAKKLNLSIEILILQTLAQSNQALIDEKSRKSSQKRIICLNRGEICDSN